MVVRDDGWLVSEPGGAEILHLPSVRTVRLLPPGPRALVWHATGGVGGPHFAEALARRIQGYRRGVDRPASWNVLVASNGAVYQSAPFSVGTWHVGRPGKISGVAYPSVNVVTIGIELENAGPLVQVAGAFYAYPFWTDASRRRPDPRCRVSHGRVCAFEGRAYDHFPPPQLASARGLIAALAKHFGWGPDEFRYCHSDFAAPAKTDPGPLWAKKVLPALFDEVFFGHDVTVVTGPPEFDPEHTPVLVMERAS